MKTELDSPLNSMLTDDREVYTVSKLNLETRAVLEECFETIWITGEISNLARPNSGHLYFSLKDNRAQVRCAFFRNNHRRLRFNPDNGQQVLIQAQVSFYEARGDFQLIVLHMEVAGAGALQLAFEQLKQRLDKEGLFAIDHKKTIPTLPKRIGVITSATGAAIRDILKVLKRRFSSIPVIIYPTLVQGEKAAEQIASTIHLANKRNECDVLLLTRGGGSLEDLWPFNEETVARAIFDCQIPIVTGVGHEIDFTIADFVADHRAATPSVAAEMVTPDQHEQIQQIDHWEQRLIQAQMHLWRHKSATLNELSLKLQSKNPFALMQSYKIKFDAIQHRLSTTLSHHFQQCQQKLASTASALNSISPLTVLNRGYAIVTQTKTGKILRKASTIKEGDRISAQLSEGSIDCRVEKIKDDSIERK